MKNEVQERFTMVENPHMVTLGKGQGRQDSWALLCLLQIKHEVLFLVVEKKEGCVHVKIFLIGRRVLGINVIFSGYVQVQHLSI